MVFVGGKLTVTARKLLQNVVHRSPGIIAVNKWAGLVCQGDSGGTQLLRPATLAALGKRKNENPRLVHRLDKPTTGVLVFGRTKEMARVLSDMFASREVTKEYWAVVVGAPTCPSGEMYSWVNSAKSVGQSGFHKLCCDGVEPEEGDVDMSQDPVGQTVDGREVPRDLSLMKTRFSVLSTAPAGEAACLRLLPETGLKHQLRIQCDRCLNTPVLGDTAHGRFSAGKGLSNWARHRLRLDGTISSRPKGNVDVPLLLHARRLTFPGLGKNGGDLVITADPPPAFFRFCESLGIPPPTDRVAAAPQSPTLSPALHGINRWGL
eukprot:m.69958 g.69958  ORF g.69958 m.69958 type:complete len:320 (-) comp18449_c0_seq1:18-977(-)